MLLMMSMEVLFVDGRSELSRRLAHRCAFLNGRDSAERTAIFRKLEDLYTRRSRLVHGDLFDKTGFLDVPNADASVAIDLVRVSLLRFIALRSAKSDLMKSLDRAIFDSSIGQEIQTRVDDHWKALGADVQTVLDVRLPEEA